MYTQYFGLDEKPFAISPDPRYLFMSERHREALAHLLYGIESDGCIFLLTGDVGTGKTTICRCLLDQLPERTDVAIILNPKLTARDLLRTICEELDISPERDTVSMKIYIDTINAHLLRSHAEGRVTALIVDEAQNLDLNVLEQLRLLTNLETNSHKLLQIFLIGQPELRDVLNKKGLAQINQRITGRYHLSPLDPEEVKTYIHHRLKVAGCVHADLISDKAIKYVVKVTRGIPRLINVLCDRALLGAYAENASHVNLRIIKQAAKEVFPKTSKTFSFNSRELVFGSAFLLGLVIAALILLPLQIKRTPQTSSQPVDQATDFNNARQAIPASNPPMQNQQVKPAASRHSAKESGLTGMADPPDASAPPAPPEETVTPPVVMPTAESAKTTIQATNEPDQPAPVTVSEIDSDTMENVSQDPYTIKISAPLIVLEQAGPIPEKKAMELILR